MISSTKIESSALTIDAQEQKCQTMAWVEAAKSGDGDAFARLVESHYSMVYGVVFSMLRDFAAAEDITQDAFLSAWSNIGNLRQTGAFSMWLKKITRNLALNWIKKVSYRRALAERRAANEPSEADSNSDSEFMMAQGERRARIESGLDSLKPKLGAALVAFYLEDQSVAEAANSLNISKSALKVRLRKGRDKLRDHFEFAWEDDLKTEFIGLSPASSRERISAYMAVGPVLLLTPHIALGTQLEMTLYQLKYEGITSITNSMLKGGALFMSTKKVVIGIAIIILALGGIYGGLNLPGKSGDPDAIPVADSPSDEAAEVADPVPDIEVNTPSEPDSGSAIASNESVAEEPLPEEEIIMSTSAGVAKRVKLAEEAQQMESDHGKIEDENQFVSVSGMVYNAQGNGIAGAQVVVQASGFSRDDPATNEFSITSAIQNPEHHFTAITDDAGTYLISGIEYEGWMYVSANAAGYALPRDSRASIQVEPGGKRDGVNVLLTPE